MTIQPKLNIFFFSLVGLMRASNGELKKFSEYDDSFGEPERAESWATYGGFQLVGHDKVTNDKCGKFSRFEGCARVDLHNRISLNGENFRNRVFVRTVHYSCGKPGCPICYRYGWAVREARNIEERLAEASNHFGVVEHISASVPVRDYGLEFETLRKKAVAVLAVRGITGGVLIFHGFRYNSPEEARQKGAMMGWYWSPHFHVLGYVLGGYGRCRGCKKGCLNCDGFEGKTAGLRKRWLHR